ncbi:MAG: glycosyltransferase family 4 protein [Chloroflexota bacterium]|nr:glycosyltransferase family 4 protein [Chloroflexota bacterium]
MRALYCSGDMVGQGGGGLLAQHEIKALRDVVGEVVVLDGSTLAPHLWKQPPSPYLYDYFALELVKNEQFDLAHFYSWGFPQTVAWLKARGTRISYTVPAHDRRVTIEEHERLGIEYPWPHIQDERLWRLFSGGYRLADVVIAQSELSARFLRQEGCANVVVIYGGTELPELVQPLPERFQAGYVGQVGVDKGIVYLLQAWAQLGYDDADLVLAGRGTDELEPSIRRIAAKGRFTLLGYVPDVSEVYSACSVIVQPSVCDAMPLEVPEAMAHGRAVIVSTGAGASEIVGDAGFIVAMRNPQAIADTLDFLKGRPDELRRMGENGRRRAGDHSWAKVRGRYVATFSALLSSR